MNFLLKCSATKDDDAANEDQEKIVIRVFGPMSFHRESEAHIMRMLSEKGMIPPVYCKFQNGVAYQYAPGKRPTREQLKDVKILRMLATKVHAIHELDLQLMDYIAQSGRPSLIASMTTIDDATVPSFKDNEEKCAKYNQYLPSQEQLNEYVQEWHDIYDDLEEKSPSVFGHFDLHTGNLIYDAKRDNLVLIHWECCNVAPEILDVAVLISKDFTFTGVFTDLDSMKQWLKVYLPTHPVYSRLPLTPDLLQKWYKDSIQASIWISFVQVVFFIDHIEDYADTLELDCLELAIKAYERFLAYRRELGTLETLPDLRMWGKENSEHRRPSSGHHGSLGEHRRLSCEHRGSLGGHRRLSCEHHGSLGGNRRLSCEHQRSFSEQRRSSEYRRSSSKVSQKSELSF